MTTDRLNPNVRPTRSDKLERMTKSHAKPYSEARSLIAAEHLAASPANARRLERALRDAKAGRRMTQMSPQQLRALAESAPKGSKRAGRKA